MDAAPEQVATPDPAETPLAPPGRIGLWFGVAAGLAFASSMLFRTVTMPLGVRFAVALLPVPALVALVLAARNVARRMDEFEQRVQLEAIAWAFAAAGTAFLLFSQFQVAGMLGPEDWIFPWLAIWAAYVMGLVSARRRYE